MSPRGAAKDLSLATGRLAGRLAGPGDEPLVRAIHADPRAAATLTAGRGIVPEARTRAVFAEMRRQQAKDGFGLWLFTVTDSDRFAGYCGLRRQELAGRPEIELLYAVVPALWRQGLATEMAAAVLTLADGPLALRETIAFTLTTNRASQRVMEKCGYRFERRFRREGLPHVLYRRRRPA